MGIITIAVNLTTIEDEYFYTSAHFQYFQYENIVVSCCRSGRGIQSLGDISTQLLHRKESEIFLLRFLFFLLKIHFSLQTAKHLFSYTATASYFISGKLWKVVE